jgi:sulfur-oxidizing protein SoxZ
MSSVRAIVNVPANARLGDVVEVRALIQHPMETGYRRGSDGQPLLRELVRRLECRFEGQLVFTAELHAAISANPYVAFQMKVPGSGTLTVLWQGDKGLQHSESVRITAT